MPRVLANLNGSLQTWWRRARSLGKKTQRDYIVDLLMKRYTEIVVEREKTGKK